MHFNSKACCFKKMKKKIFNKKFLNDVKSNKDALCINILIQKYLYYE